MEEYSMYVHGVAARPLPYCTRKDACNSAKSVASHLVALGLTALLLGTTAFAGRKVLDEEEGSDLSSQLEIAGWQLEYVEDFGCESSCGASRMPLDSTVWEHQLGNGVEYNLTGWGNGEPEFYTDGLANSAVVRERGAHDGCALQISVLRGPAPFAYTSARIRAKMSGPLGAIQPTPPSGGLPSRGVRVAARIALPTGTASGIWPAFWMLPVPNEYGGWAASGEIDILETSGPMNIIRSTIHYGGLWPNNVYTGGTVELNAASPATGPEYHIFAVEWSYERITFYVDAIIVYQVDQQTWFSSAVDKTIDPAAPFDKPFQVILNIAAGGWNWAGYPPDDAVFPQSMFVDYVSVHRQL